MKVGKTEGCGRANEDAMRGTKVKQGGLEKEKRARRSAFHEGATYAEDSARVVALNLGVKVDAIVAIDNGRGDQTQHVALSVGETALANQPPR